MIGTNMLQTTIHLTVAPPQARRRARRGSIARRCAAGVCAATLLAWSSLALAAQGAPAAGPPAANPPPTSPAAMPPTEVPGAQQGASELNKLFPNAPTSPLTPPPAELQGLQEGAADAAKKLFPNVPGPPPAPEGSADTRGLDQDIQGLKKDVVDLNKDLFILEEELLFPANTQVAVFLSVDVGDFFALDAVQLKIDRKEVINYLYTPRERDALLKGGVQRLYLGNLKVGQHELVAFFSGTGPNARAYKRGASLRFEKGVGAKYLELKINDRQRKLAPEFEIKDWE
jgi:hypothetical protein